MGFIRKRAICVVFRFKLSSSRRRGRSLFGYCSRQVGEHCRQRCSAALRMHARARSHFGTLCAAAHALGVRMHCSLLSLPWLGGEALEPIRITSCTSGMWAAETPSTMGPSARGYDWEGPPLESAAAELARLDRDFKWRPWPGRCNEEAARHRAAPRRPRTGSSIFGRLGVGGTALGGISATCGLL